MSDGVVGATKLGDQRNRRSVGLSVTDEVWD